MPVSAVGQARVALAALVPLTFAGDALTGALPIGAAFALGVAGVLAAWRPAFAVLAGALVAAASLGALGGEEALLMAHHRWLLASLLVWLGLPVSDADRGRLVRWQLAALYGYAAIDKLEAGWFDGTRATQLLLDADPATPLVHLAPPGALESAGAVVVGGQLLVPALLAHPRGLRAALAIAFPFHVGVEWLFDVGTFTPIVAAGWFACADRPIPARMPSRVLPG